MRKLRWLIALWLVSAAAAWPAGQLQGTVTTPEGQGLLARVLVINPQTRASAWVYTDAAGRFVSEAPDGDLTVRASHGPEWTIAETQARAGGQVQLVLQRLLDMTAQGYYGTDLHMHSTFSDGKQSPADVALVCRGEGLHVAALTDHAKVEQQGEWLQQQAPDFLPLRGEEISTALGHLIGINISRLVSTDTLHGPDDIARIYREVHEQGGLAFVAHPNIPGMTYQTPDLRDYDAIEILNGSVPPYGGVFDFIQGRKAWHSALSAGRKVAVIGNSDSHDGLATMARELLRDPKQAAQMDKRVAAIVAMIDVEKVLVPWGWKGVTNGTYRTYLKLESPSPEGVAAAIRAGRGFVTNGPLIVARLDGADPGVEIMVGDRQTLELTAEVVANRPVERLDVVVSGQVAASVANPERQVRLAVPVRQGGWVTVELYGPWPEFATTNAWYIR